MDKLLPNIYQKDIYSINYDRLKKQGITTLIYDLDNTLIDNRKKVADENLKKLFNELKGKGFKIIILSNALPNRLKKFSKSIQLNDYYALALKPYSRNYLKIIKKYNLKRTEIACIGDQIYTDIKGANKLNLISILVDPISKFEHITTKLNRIKERKIYKKHIKKGDYYE